MAVFLPLSLEVCNKMPDKGRMKPIVTLFALLAVLAACQRAEPPATVALNAVNGMFMDDRVEQDKNYQVNTLQTVYVGQPVIKRKTYLAKVKSELVGVPAMDIQLSARDVVLSLRGGKAYPIKYEVNIQGRLYSVLEVYHNVNDRYYGVLIGQDGAPASLVLDGNVQLPGQFTISPLNAAVGQQRMETVVSRENTENFELVFGGITDNEINLTYREFSPGDVAKTAFYQNLTYPRDSAFIRYQNLQIKVHQTTPEFISYVVVQE
jgi:hypothetical protein